MALIICQKSLALRTHVEKKYSCLKPAMIVLFSNFLVLTNFLVRKQSIFVVASDKKKNIDNNLNSEPVNNHAIML